MTTQIFYYKLLDAQGGLKTGHIAASNIKTAELKLQENAGVTIILIKPEPPLRKWLSLFKDAFIHYILPQPQLKMNELLYFTREINSYLRSGLPLLNALITFQGIITQKSFYRIVDSLILDLKKGVSFSEALSRYPKSFPHNYIAAIKGGEVSGRLTDELSDNFRLLEWESKTMKKLRMLLTVPFFVVILLTMVLYLMLFFLIPRVVPFLKRSGKPIPVVTQFLILLRDIITQYKDDVLMGLLIVGMGIIAMLFTKKGRYWIDYALLRLPVIGNLYKIFMSMKFCQTFYVLYGSGIPILDSFSICSELFKGGVFEKEVNGMAVQLRNGKSLGETFGRSILFPVLMSEMIKGAEKTGNLSDTLKNLGELYSNRLEYRVNDLMALIEPVYIIFVTCYVVLLLLGFYIPLLSVAIPD